MKLQLTISIERTPAPTPCTREHSEPAAAPVVDAKAGASTERRGEYSYRGPVGFMSTPAQETA